MREALLHYGRRLTWSSKSNWFWSWRARSASCLTSESPCFIDEFALAFLFSHSSKVKTGASSTFPFPLCFPPLAKRSPRPLRFIFSSSFCAAAWFWTGIDSTTVKQESYSNVPNTITVLLIIHWHLINHHSSVTLCYPDSAVKSSMETCPSVRLANILYILSSVHTKSDCPTWVFYVK